jgi:hypothetical protein
MEQYPAAATCTCKHQVRAGHPIQRECLHKCRAEVLSNLCEYSPSVESDHDGQGDSFMLMAAASDDLFGNLLDKLVLFSLCKHRQDLLILQSKSTQVLYLPSQRQLAQRILENYPPPCHRICFLLVYPQLA